MTVCIEFSGKTCFQLVIKLGVFYQVAWIFRLKNLHFCVKKVFDPGYAFKLRNVLPVFVKQMFKVTFKLMF